MYSFTKSVLDQQSVFLWLFFICENDKIMDVGFVNTLTYFFTRKEEYLK